MGARAIIVLNIGLIGLVVLMALNLVSHFSFQQPAAELFASVWWVTWGPSYLVWLVFIAIGLAGLLRARDH